MLFLCSLECNSIHACKEHVWCRRSKKVDPASESIERSSSHLAEIQKKKKKLHWNLFIRWFVIRQYKGGPPSVVAKQKCIVYIHN